MKIYYGQYTGDGTSSRAVTGIGFALNVTNSLVQIKSQGFDNGVFRTDRFSSTGSMSLREDSGMFTTGIISLDSNGFTVGNDSRVNNTGTVYYFLCVVNDASNDFNTGTWTGNSTDNRGITGFGFKPGSTFIKGDLGRTGCAGFSTQPANHASLFYSGSDEINSSLRSPSDSDGVTLGTSDKTNNSGTTYYYFAFKDAGSNSAAISFTGDGTNSRPITTSFQPGWVYLKADNGVNASFRSTSYAANTSQIGWDQNTSTAAIKSFGATSFVVDNDSTSNQNSQVYYGYYLGVATGGGGATAYGSSLTLMGIGN